MATAKHPTRRSREAVFVLGMHRSGTSALGGVLVNLGVQAPRSLMEPTNDNPKGYWESVELMKVHDQILRSAGSRWNDWGRFNPDWAASVVSADHMDALKQALDREFDEAPFFLVKDPRICRFFPLWQEVLQEKGIIPKVILSVRHPLEVARSLETRDHFGRNRSLLLWLRHVLDAEVSTRSAKRSFISYKALLDDWKGTASKISAELDIKWPKLSGDSEALISQFIGTSLQHHIVGQKEIVGDSELHAWVNEVYRRLIELADGTANESETYEVLDSIRHEFDRTSDIYGAVVREHENRVEGLYAGIKAKLQEKTRAMQELTAAHDAVRRELNDRHEASEHSARQEVVDLHQSIAARDAEISGVLSAHKDSLDAFAKQIEGKESRIQELEQRIDKELAKNHESVDKISCMVQKAEQQATQLAERDVKLKSLSKDKEDLAQLIDKRAEELANVRASLEKAQASVDERFKETARLTGMVLELEKTVSSQAASLAQQEHSYRISIAKAEALLEFAQAYHTKSVDALESQIKAWKVSAESLLQLVHALISSVRWRLVQAFGKKPMLPEMPTSIGSDTAHQLHLLKNSKLFNHEWYRKAHPEIGEMDPTVHYVLKGAVAGYDPGPEFSTLGYLSRYKDVRRSGTNPLVHYLEHGQVEGRSTAGPESGAA